MMHIPNEVESTQQEQLMQAQAWLERDLYQLEQMVQTLQDFYSLTPGDIKHLNRHAKRTILSMLPALVDSIFIRIARLTEPAKRCGRDNLTLGSLVHLLRASGEKLKSDKIESLLKNVQLNSSSIREDHRNKRYAHIDFSVALNSKKLPPVPVRLIREVTDSIQHLVLEATDSGYSFKATPQGNIKRLAETLGDYYELKTANMKIRND